MKRGTAGSKYTVMPLSEIQLRTATIILALPEAAGFALAGGAALVIHEIVDRGTKDLDCFGPSTDAVNQLVDPTLDALAAAGLQTKLMLRADGFSKIVVADEHERTQVDLGFDPASHDPVRFGSDRFVTSATSPATNYSRSSPVLRPETSSMSPLFYDVSPSPNSARLPHQRTRASTSMSLPTPSASSRHTTATTSTQPSTTTTITHSPPYSPTGNERFASDSQPVERHRR